MITDPDPASGLDLHDVKTAAVVAPSPVPLRFGGAERHWDALRAGLEHRGISTDIIKIPVREDRLTDLLDSYEAFRFIDLSHVDLVITGKYPAWMVQHPRHVVWMLHPLRGLYDTYNPAAFEDRRTPDSQSMPALSRALSADPSRIDPLEIIDLTRAVADELGPDSTAPSGPLSLPGPLSRSVIQSLDSWALSPRRVHKYMAISEVVANRHSYFPRGKVIQVLHPPPIGPDQSASEDGSQRSEETRQRTQGARKPQFLALSRLEPAKRVDLAIGAFRRVDDPEARLVVVGEGSQRRALEDQASGDHRISFRGFVSDSEVDRLQRDSLAAVVTPLEEDFGYVTVEAMRRSTPAITTTDSGGPAEMVHDGVDSLVVEPTERALAGAMQQLLDSPALAAQLGAAAHDSVTHLNWKAAIDEILRPVETVVRRQSRKIVAVSTYPVKGARGGGPQRASHLLSALAEFGWEVVVVCLDAEGVATTPAPDDGFRQVAVAPSVRHAEAEAQLRRLTANVSITDIGATVLWSATPEFVAALTHELSDATAVVAVQPYLAPAVAAIDPDAPLILDAHNVEIDLKRAMLPDDEAGRWMLHRVADAERLAASSSALMAATTAADAALLRGEYNLDGAKILLIPNGADSRETTFTEADVRKANAQALIDEFSATDSQRCVALFVGSAHGPNMNAAGSIVEMAAAIPEVLVLLAGEHSLHVDTSDRENVRALGGVSADRLAQLLAGANVALNPIAMGSGSNLKVLEYFAAGVPVVSTLAGVRGIDEPTRFANVASIGNFPAAIRETLGSDNRQMVRDARVMVDEHFDWARIGAQFAAGVTAVLDGQPESQPIDEGRPPT